MCTPILHHPHDSIVALCFMCMFFVVVRLLFSCCCRKASNKTEQQKRHRQYSHNYFPLNSTKTEYEKHSRQFGKYTHVNTIIQSNKINLEIPVNIFNICPIWMRFTVKKYTEFWYSISEFGSLFTVLILDLNKIKNQNSLIDLATYETILLYLCCAVIWNLFFHKFTIRMCSIRK